MKFAGASGVSRFEIQKRRCPPHYCERERRRRLHYAAISAGWRAPRRHCIGGPVQNHQRERRVHDPDAASKMRAARHHRDLMVSLPEGIEFVSFLRSGDSVLLPAGAPPGSLFSQSNPCFSRIHQNGLVLFPLRNFTFASVEVVKVLFLNRVYPPAHGATGQLLADLAAELTKLGWHVTVVTSVAAGSRSCSQTIDGVRLERVGASC